VESTTAHNQATLQFIFDNGCSSIGSPDIDFALMASSHEDSEHLDEELDESETPFRGTLQQLLAGLIPILKSTQAQIRLGLRKRSIINFHNMARGDIGILIMLPATRQAAMTVETTDFIPPGIVLALLEALEQQLRQPDKRIAQMIEEYKAMHAAVRSRGAGGESYSGPTTPYFCWHGAEPYNVGTSYQLTPMCLCHCSI
jgi:hypothetical protein